MWRFIVLDYFFLVFHSALILVNLFGWIHSKTRMLQRVCLTLTLCSWIFMGIVYGWGYCALTDWHWDVLTELQRRPDTNVYVAYLFDRLLNLEISRRTSDILTVGGLLFGIIGSIWAGWKDKYRLDKVKETR